MQHYKDELEALHLSFKMKIRNNYPKTVELHMEETEDTWSVVWDSNVHENNASEHGSAYLVLVTVHYCR